MKKTLITSFLSLAALASTAFAAGDAWMTDFEAAKALAAEQEKDLLLEFTGSDWCPPCKDLTARVLSKNEFQTEAQKDFVLVVLDFPNDRSEMSEETIKQNEKLQGEYGIEGYPTLILASADGSAYAAIGHNSDGPEDYAAGLVSLKEGYSSQKTLLKEADSLEGLAKAQKLHMALNAFPANSHPPKSDSLKDLEEQIIALDPDDTLGVKTKRENDTKVQAFFQGLDEEAEPSDLLEQVDTFLSENTSLDPQARQQVGSLKVDLHMQAGEFGQAETKLVELIALAPDTDFGKMAANFLPQLKQMREQAANAKAAKDSE